MRHLTSEEISDQSFGCGSKSRDEHVGDHIPPYLHRQRVVTEIAEESSQLGKNEI